MEVMNYIEKYTYNNGYLVLYKHPNERIKRIKKKRRNYVLFNFMLHNLLAARTATVTTTLAALRLTTRVATAARVATALIVATTALHVTTAALIVATTHHVATAARVAAAIATRCHRWQCIHRLCCSICWVHDLLY
jgi:hypothetical protein